MPSLVSSMTASRDPLTMEMGCDASSGGNLMHSEIERNACAAMLFLGVKGRCWQVEARDGDDAWEGATHWECRISTPLGRRSIPFSQGPAHVKPPTIFDCVCALLESAQLLQEIDCPEESLHSGYSENLTQAKRHFNDLKRASAQAHALLGSLAVASTSEELLEAAIELAGHKKRLDKAREGKPFGLMELACWCMDVSALARLAQEIEPSKAELESLLATAKVCESSADCLEAVAALLERQELAESTPKRQNKTKGPWAL